METIQKETQIIEQAKRDIYAKHGDSGTCVMGMELYYKGRKLAGQIVQGSVTNEFYFKEIKSRLLATGQYDASGFDIEYGVMD